MHDQPAAARIETQRVDRTLPRDCVLVAETSVAISSSVWTVPNFDVSSTVPTVQFFPFGIEDETVYVAAGGTQCFRAQKRE